jgi:PAS domain S-box-containing protein
MLLKGLPSESTNSPTVRERQITRRLEEVTRERNLYAKTLAEANRLYEEKVRELNSLRRVGDALRSVQSVRKVCCEIVDILVEEVGAKNCSLMLLDRDEGTLSIKAARGQGDAQARYFERSDPEGRFTLGEGVAGWVAEHAEPVLIPDTSRDERFKPAEAGGLDIRSLLCLPLIEGNQVWGVLNLSHSDINAFTEDNERILTIIANQAGIALANVGLFQQLQEMNEALEETVAVRTREVRKTAEQIAVINRIAKTINSVIDPEQVFGVIVDEIRKLLVFDRASIATLDEKTGTLKVTALDVESGASARTRLVALTDSIVSRSLREGRVTAFDAKDAGQAGELIDMKGLAAGVIVPLIFQERAKGTLVLGSSSQDGFSGKDQDLLGGLSEHIAAAVEKSRLYNEVRKMNEELEEMVVERTRELSESEARYRALFEKSAEAIFLVSESGHIINANDRWTQLTGMKPADSEHLTLDEGEGGTALPLHAWTRKAANTETLIPELSLTRSDGTRRIVELRLNPIDVMGQHTILGVAHDITRRKELEEQLLRSEKLAAMGTLAASVAHEINNPLEGIKNCLNVLKGKMKAEQTEAELLDLVEKGFIRIRDIVRKVLDFHKPAATVMEPLDLNNVLGGLLGLFRNDFNNRNVKLVLNLTPQLRQVFGNRSHLEQVFTNIILNAEDAMDKGGALTVVTSHTAEEVTVSFVDTGHGISREDLKNVLQPFFTRKRSGKGTGLGLWISHSVVQDHHGRLEIASEPGKGTTVSVVLPVLAGHGGRGTAPTTP